MKSEFSRKSFDPELYTSQIYNGVMREKESSVHSKSSSQNQPLLNVLLKLNLLQVQVLQLNPIYP